mmetsp:Transcript_48283/g.126255  ORF Transcript_48283/g.126255 Transcript_48283/m.126255 type:complete len:94 (+) Transcript_48283:56-337(+)
MGALQCANSYTVINTKLVDVQAVAHLALKCLIYCIPGARHEVPCANCTTGAPGVASCMPVAEKPSCSSVASLAGAAAGGAVGASEYSRSPRHM